MVSIIKLQETISNYHKSNPLDFVQCDWVAGDIPDGKHGTFTLHNNGYGKTFWRIVFTNDSLIVRAVGPVPTCFLKVILNTNSHTTVNKWRIKALDKQIKWNKEELNITKASAKSSISSFQKQISDLVNRRSKFE